MPIQSDLEKIKDWAQNKAQSGSEPPWAWYQYMKLIEAVNAILAGIASTTTGSSPQLEERRGKLLQLGEPRRLQDAAQQHPDTAEISLPM